MIQFGAVVRLRIGEMRVMMGAEIDCFDGDHRPRQQQQQHQDGSSLDSFIELKTYKPPQNSKQESTLLRFKYPRWWVQSWLGGVPRIALGSRDDRGMLRDIEVRREMHTTGANGVLSYPPFVREIPLLLRRERPLWQEDSASLHLLLVPLYHQEQ